jgi:hypothetical protein
MIKAARTLVKSTCVLWMLVGCDPGRSWQSTATAVADQRPGLPTAHDGEKPMLPEISVELLGPITTLKGHAWTRGYDLVHDKPDQPLSQILANEPHELVIHLPGGRTIRNVSKATFFTQKRGVVDRVSLMPHLGPAMKFQDAIALLERTLKEWDAEPDEPTKESLTKWKAEGDLKPWELAQRDGGAVLHGENKAGISFNIRPTSSNAGWYLAIDVAATLEEERKLWGSGRPPASHPARSTSDGSREGDRTKQRLIDHCKTIETHEPLNGGYDQRAGLHARW